LLIGVRPGRERKLAILRYSEAGVNSDDGSNAWAFAPGRTKSGKAILVRNPHLAWTAGYYEAHVTVPGVLDFYGDFRVGGPFIVVGGFNRYLGWSTTNNSQDLSGDLRARCRSQSH
jgi:acyl-homoserine-lactone acylase